MMKSLKNILIFVCICSVITVLLATTNFITAPTIAKNQSAAANKALLEVMPEGSGFEKMDLSGYTLPTTVTEVQKETAGKGYVVTLVTKGYGAGFTIMCGVTADGTITGAVCLSSNETLSKEKTYGENFAGKDAAGVDAVDTISNATLTTAAYKNAVKDALNTAVILGGGEADLRTPEEIFNDNLKAALPEADEFIKRPVADQNAAISFIYAAKNGVGYVYVVEDTFVGVDAQGKVITAGVSSEIATAAETAAALAATHTTVDITDKGINENVTSVQKNAEGNYVVEVNGLGFAYFGDESHYVAGKEIPIKICTVISQNGVMLECLTVSHSESSGYGAAWGTEEYYGQFDGKTEETYKDVDIVGGATISNNGYLKAIQRAFAAVKVLEGGNQ